MDLHDIGPAEKFLDDLEAYAARTNHARIVRKVPVTFGPISGREVELENEKGWQRIVRDYLVGSRIYCIGAQARDHKLNREMVNGFLDSFALLEGDAPPPTVMPAPSPVPSAVPAPSADVRSRPAPEVSVPPALQWTERAPSGLPAPPSPQRNAPAVDHRYANRAGRYLVDFPVAPSESERQLPNGATLHLAVMELRGVGYAVTYYDLTASALDRIQTVPEGLAAVQSAWKDEVTSQLHATLQHDGPVQVAGRAGYEAEFVLADGTHLIGRVVIVGARCYRFALAGAGITSDTPLVRQYLDSFGLID
jgi:hypothetical protein